MDKAKSTEKRILHFHYGNREGLPTPWLQILKQGVKLRGVDAGYCRKPAISELPADVMDKLKAVLKEYGYIA